MARVDDARLVISDYKSTVIANDQGEVLPEVRAQLELYGLLAAEMEPGVRLTLRVTEVGGESIDLVLEGEWMTKRRAWLEQLLARMPKGVPLDARQLASAGSHCTGCPIRHRCTVYQVAAQTAWRQPHLDHAWPLDTWGEVQGAESRQAGLISLVLRDAAGRLVRVDRLEAAMLGNVPKAGDDVYFFSLHAHELPPTALARPHPSNFYEVAPNRQLDTAYGLSAFAKAHSDR